MKKIVSIALLAGLLAFSSGCGGSSSEASKKTTGPSPADMINKAKDATKDKSKD